MKRFLLLAFLSVILVTFPLYGQTDTVTIFHINDTHGNLAPIGPRDSFTPQGELGGIARLATMIGLDRPYYPNSLFLHAGDFSIGDIFYNKYFGVPELRILKSLGLDAMTLGNHEFDLTPSTLLTALDSGFVDGGFPILSANTILDDPSLARLKEYVKPYTIKQVGNVKVGIFGLTTPATNLLSQPSPAVVDTNFIQTAAAIVETLQTQGCSLVICLSHLGFSYDKMVAQYVPGIHVIAGGHDHLTLNGQAKVVKNPLGDDVFIVQADAFYLHLGMLRVIVGGGKVRLLDYALYPLHSATTEEPTVKAMVDGMIADIESVYGPVYTQKIADVTADFQEVADSLMSHGAHDTPIGNLVTDAFRATTNTDIAMEVGGSTAEPLYHGFIVPADAFRVVGYGFNTVNGLGYRLATFEMSGAALIMGLEFGLSAIDQDDEFLVQVSGLKYYYNSDRDPYTRLDSATVGGAPLNPAAMYTVTANEFVPMFLSSFGIPYDNLHICSDTTEFSVLAGYIQQRASLTPVVEGRVFNNVPPTAVSPGRGEMIPEFFRLEQNYPNPFNPSTVIKYTVGGNGAWGVGDEEKAGTRGSGLGTSKTRLVVYDVLGRQVATLVDEVKAPGSYEVRFDGSGLASGLYLYSLSAGSFLAVKKMMLVK